MRMRPTTSVVIVAVLGFALSGCSAIESLTHCARGVEGADTAAHGLIDAARTAKTPSDLCRWVTPTMSVSQSQLDELKKTYLREPDDALTIRVGDQMGSTVPVLVTSNDGTVSQTLDGSADSHGKWTIAYGTPLGATAPTGPSSATTPSPTPRADG